MATSAASKIPIGTVLADKYRVTREIGRGGMAAVYEAENIHIGKRVAVKVLAAELTASTIVVERFLREARAAASISSPYICDVYDSGKLDDGRPFLVLELLEGESLYERMTRVRQIDVPTTVKMVAQVARGLTKAHAANIVHRDLKPENIFLTKDEEGHLLAKILDFGLAKFYAPVDDDAVQARLTREGAVFGTPAYMSPEQVKGQGQVDHRADLWALGCMAYECLTGRTVWSTEQGVAMTFAQIATAPLPNALAFRPDLPPSFQAWFEKALARSENDRFQTARDLADGLAAALAPNAGDPASLPSLSDASDDARAAENGGRGRAPGTEQGLNGPSGSGPGPVSGPRGMAAAAPVASPPSSPHRGNAARPPRKSTRALVSLLAVPGILAAGYFGWLLLIRPAAAPVATVTSAPVPASAAPAPDVSANAPKGPKWLPMVTAAQAQVAAGNLPEAVRALKEAVDIAPTSNGTARALYEQAQVAAAAKGPCKVTGIARPRPSTLVGPASRPTLVFTPRGALIVWTDDHESAGHDHAYAVLLDSAMRSAGPALDVTPEGALVSRPHLLAVGDRVVLVYADMKGGEAGIHARWLDAEGHIAGPARAITARKPGPNVSPVLERAPDGTFWAAWEDDRQSDSSDLYLRRLSAELEPLGNELRATDYVPRGRKPRVRAPSLGIAGGFLNVAFRFEREPQHLVELLRIGLLDPALPKGLDGPAEKPSGKDRELGDVKLVSSDREKADAPFIRCATEGCYLAWHGEAGGAYAAYMEASHGQILWRKKFEPKGAHPTVAIAPSGAAELAWFEGGRLKIATMTRDGVGLATVISRASGDPPPPALAPGGVPGEWYVSWLDAEAGHPELFGTRALCK